MTAFACHAAEFLRSEGPAQIPLRACCAAAVIRSGGAHSPGTGLSSAPFVCAAAGLTALTDGRSAPDPAAACLATSPDGRPADDPAVASAAIPAEARQAVDSVVVGAAEQSS
jgi:hypothetical protein